ncbi:Rpn family recombination-promoting nuclease/putative transposase [Brachyspira sp. G79]|uniref:Rpn family recombination-promoting nuclease/putative transposase n=1 Tax=Brachyspira sp. G79 TaxID=1358104 RepID=UPI000BBCF31E|nr:Rpn family recombination-promoting nuclease/putative transposase [Brachyspira sp. G79]PCG18769.1 hypothetical protein KQ44_13645 [Brachyspira sp. G79]
MKENEIITIDTLNKKNDCFVRYLFSNLGNENIVLNFINSAMNNLNFSTFIKLEILNPFNLQKYLNSKESIVDIKCETDTGEIVMIEIQLQGNESFANRVLFYWANGYSLTLNKGEDYKKLCPVISINILNFILSYDIEDCHTCYVIKELKHNKILTDHCQLHFLELPKFNNNNSLKTDLNSWFKFFNGGESMENLIKENTIFNEVERRCKSFISDNPLLDAYRKKEIDEYFYKDTMKREREKGFNEGIEKGKFEQQKIIAKSLKTSGMNLEFISRNTGLSIEEIEKL